MQCPSCRFENMPGLVSCGRCGSVLDLNSAAIDIHPPRASKLARRVRKYVPRTAIYQARDAATDARQTLIGQFEIGARVPLPTPEIAARLLVPGWAHQHSGASLRGKFFFFIYLFALSLGLIRWGTESGALFLGLAFSVHASSILDVLIRQGRVRFPAMMTTAGIVAVVLALLIYFPAGAALNQLASPIRFDYDAEPFHRYDNVLVNRWVFAWRNPRPGDVVRFRPAIGRNTDAGGNTPMIHARLLVNENSLIDRVLGAPGDRVVWSHGELRVNEQRVSWGPLLPQKLPERLEINVPSGHYLILPTTSRAMHGGEPALAWETLGLVSPAEIEGRAFVRNAPISRFWIIR